MSFDLGNKLRISVFGASHGPAVGVVMEGLPAGEYIDADRLQAFMDRRRPGQSDLTTPRKEADMPQILSGLKGEVTCGSPLTAVIYNTDTRSKDYDKMIDVPRPGHADYTAWVKWGGQADMRGSGCFSARLTAPLCIAGGIAGQLLARCGVYTGAHLAQVGTVKDEPFPLLPQKELFERLAQKPLAVISDAAGEKMAATIREAAAQLDSVGGVVEGAAIGLPAGLGGPLFGGVEGRMAQALFGIPGVKGVDFGAGFGAAEMRGSCHNDPFYYNERGEAVTATNHSGGILGGITNGMPLVMRAALKPTSSIGIEQQSISLSGKCAAPLTVTGRHDPCIAVRAVPVVEAVMNIVLLDMMLEEGVF